jgi:ribulose-phosphate 3-epimerase
MITPIIMESDLKVVTAKMLSLKERKIDRVHMDIGDGLFSDLLTISPSDLQEIDTANMKMDIHLLVDDPSEWIEECVALNPKRLIGQIERMGSQVQFLDTIESYKCAGGLALEIHTPIEEIEKEALDKARVILLLAVPAGTSGSPFDEHVIEKVKELKKIYSGAILIDGAINPNTYTMIIDAGATEAGANSAWWRGDFDE